MSRLVGGDRRWRIRYRRNTNELLRNLSNLISYEKRHDGQNIIAAQRKEAIERHEKSEISQGSRAEVEEESGPHSHVASSLAYQWLR